MKPIIRFKERIDTSKKDEQGGRQGSHVQGKVKDAVMISKALSDSPSQISEEGQE